MIKLFMVKNIIFATFNLKDTLNYSLINLTAMRKTLLLSLFVLFSAMVGWAQDSGKDLGLKLLKSTEITDGMQLAFQSVSTTNPLNWFQGAVAAGDFGESVIFVAEATGETAADGKALYVLRQKSAEESVAYLQMPAANNSDVTMGARETAAEITFNPYNEHEHADNAKLEGEFSEEYSTRVTLQFDASTQTFLNCNSAGTIVHWGTGFGSWSYWNIYEIPADFRLVPVTYNITFFDGSTDVTLEEAGLSDLIPSAVVEGEGSVTAEAIVGGKVAFPTFSNTTLRRALKTDGTVLSEEETFVLSEDLLEGDALTLNLEYSSDPRILFECSIDASMFGPEDDPSLFVFDETGTAEMEKSVRVAVGEAITAPAISHFTALTAIEEEATQSKTISVSYRPWRRIYVDGYVLNADGSLPAEGEEIFLFSGEEMFVDIDSTITAPDLGSLYTFNAEQTNLSSYNDPDRKLPLVVTGDNIVDGDYFTFFYDMNMPFKSTDVAADGTVPEDATWYILRFRNDKVLTGNLTAEGAWQVGGVPVQLLVLDAGAVIDDYALWCIRDNGDGTYSLFNKANPGMVLSDDGTVPAFVIATGAEVGVTLTSIGDGYGLIATQSNGTQAYLNDNGGNGILYYWSAADDGSKVTFEEYDPKRYTFLLGRSALNGVNCINGYTEDQVAEIREIIEEGNVELEQDVEDMVLDLIETPAEELIQHNPANGYAIISAAETYITRDNVQYALYLDGDSVLAWKEFNKHDPSFYFELGDFETLTSMSGEADSTVCSIKSITSGKYIDASEWAFQQPLGASEEYNAETMRFHMAPAVAEYDQESGDETVAAVPAGFYIDRWWYSGGNTDGEKVKCTMCMHAGTIDASTSGTIISYNTHGRSYANVFRFWDGGPIETVGIGSVTNDENVNGAKNDAIYDLSGRRVEKAVKGIYIQNGKKVYVK